MSENSQSEVEVDPYEEIVGLNLAHKWPVEPRVLLTTHFNGPIVKCSESEAVSTSTGLVASVTRPDLRYPCSLAGKNSSATVAQHLDGNRLRATFLAMSVIFFIFFVCASISREPLDWFAPNSQGRRVWVWKCYENVNVTGQRSR